MSASTDSLGTRVDPEEIKQTTSEKALAVVLAIFIFVGAIWGYVKLAEVDRPGRGDRISAGEISEESRGALARETQARREVENARKELAAATNELTLRREEYRTALDAGSPSGDLRLAYVEAQANLELSETAAQDADLFLDEIAPAAEAARAELSAQRTEALEASRDSARSHDRTVLLLRLGLILGMAAGAMVTLGLLRSRRSRYLPLAVAWLAAAALLGVVLAADYSWGEFTDISDLGPLLLSIVGVAMTLAAFVALQRHLSRRLTIRRLRRRECPFCGFPGDGDHCEGCGRRLVGECAECHSPRRVGTPNCATCGKA